MKYWQHGETGRVVATENELAGEWYEIEAEQYEEALHPLSPANKVLQSDTAYACPDCGSESLIDHHWHCPRCP